MIHLYQIAKLITNGHYTFKQLSESVAQNWNNVTEKSSSNLPLANRTNQYGLLNGTASHQY